MWRWWGPVQAAPEQCPTPRRTVKTKQLHVEVIGGSNTYSAQWDSKKPSTSKQPIRATISGPPRLPAELTTHILLLAAQLVTEEKGGTLLQLALVDRAAQHAIFANYILPKLRLCGVQQVNAFARDLQRNVLNLQAQVRRVKQLTVWRARERATLEFMRASSLFSGAEEVAHFEKATLKPLQIILSYCKNIEILSLDMPARVLDDRNYNSLSQAEGHIGKTLKELTTLLSVYGGDLNEALWAPGTSLFPKWNNLTHLQLHGPRFRMTSLTALAISQLPSLTHLALIMPLLVQPQIPSTGPSNLIESQVDNSRDALGRCNVLQILIDALGHRLETLLLVCHDVESYVGNVQRLGPWMRTLQWKCNTTSQQTHTRQGAKMILVTASPYNPLQTTPHPSLYSKWLMQRAERGDHWKWTQKNNVEGFDVCEEMKLAYTVESWRVPIVFDDSSAKEDAPANDESRRAQAEALEDTQQLDDQIESPWSDSDEAHGIDNLD